MPGGESTTISMLAERNQLLEPLTERVRGGMPTFGTCAGMLFLSAGATDGRTDQHYLGALDVDMARNAYGSQVESFETCLEVPAVGPEPMQCVFIRAPIVTRTSPQVEVLASFDGHPVICRQGAVLGCTFHPELSGDWRLHELFCREDY